MKKIEFFALILEVNYLTVYNGNYNGKGAKKTRYLKQITFWWNFGKSETTL